MKGLTSDKAVELAISTEIFIRDAAQPRNIGNSVVIKPAILVTKMQAPSCSKILFNVCQMRLILVDAPGELSLIRILFRIYGIISDKLAQHLYQLTKGHLFHKHRLSLRRSIGRRI